MDSIIVITDSDVHHNNFGVQYKYVLDLNQNTEIYPTTEQVETEYVSDDVDTSLVVTIVTTSNVPTA